MKIKKLKGFTLIELLVVIVIIGILATFVVLALSGYQKRAKEARVKDTVKSVFTAAQVTYDSGGASPTGIGITGRANLWQAINSSTLQTILATTDGTKATASSVPSGVSLYVYVDGTGGIAIYARSALDSGGTTRCWYQSTGGSNLSDSAPSATYCDPNRIPL